jgi:hypothetical protein
MRAKSRGELRRLNGEGEVSRGRERHRPVEEM